MKKLTRLFYWIVFCILVLILAIRLEDYREEQRELDRVHLMCQRSDVRLIREGWIKCSDNK